MEHISDLNIKRILSLSTIKLIDKLALIAVKLIACVNMLLITLLIVLEKHVMCLNDYPQDTWCKLPHQIMKNGLLLIELIVKVIVSITFAISVDKIPVLEINI